MSQSRWSSPSYPKEPKVLKLDEAKLFRMLQSKLSETGLLKAELPQDEMTKLLDDKLSEAELTKALVIRLFNHELSPAEGFKLFKAKAKKPVMKISELINAVPLWMGKPDEAPKD